jgi:hypothetical protein
MKSPGPCLGGEFQVLAPAHARAALHHVDHALQVAVVVRAGLRVGVDGDGARPQLLRADAREVDRGARSMPGVCAVFGSSWLPGITRTPSCFHFACSWGGSWG